MTDTAKMLYWHTDGCNYRLRTLQANVVDDLFDLLRGLESGLVSQYPFSFMRVFEIRVFERIGSGVINTRGVKHLTKRTS